MAAETFNDRLASLRLNVDALEQVRVHFQGGTRVIPNEEGKRGSLQVYAAITSNDGYISLESAKRGLNLFGNELRLEACNNPGKHPSIDLLEEIVSAGAAVRSDVIRRPEAKPLFASEQRLAVIAEEFGTPFHLYDEAGIVRTARQLNSAFPWVQKVNGFGFKNYFAVKALPNPHILKILHKERMGADCSSLPELVTADAVSMEGKGIMFTSNNTPSTEFAKAVELGAIVNFDDLTHIRSFIQDVGDLPELACCRFNPGDLKRGGSFIGDTKQAKYGFTREQLSEGFKKLRDGGVRRFGLHTMVASNELDPEYFVDTARILFETANELTRELGICFEFINLGGGIGTPYRPEQIPVDLERVSEGIKREYDRIVTGNSLWPLRVVMENGRMVTGPHGILVSRVLHVAKKHRNYVGLDTSMQNLMRPALYNAYHHITVLGRDNAHPEEVYDVTGSLCENNDKFAVNRLLPRVHEGDLVAIHNTGAHGAAMGFQYNGKLRCQELLLRPNGDVRMIRRAETLKDYFATLDFPDSDYSDLAIDP